MNGDVIDLIKNVGFPIVMCLLYYVDMRKILVELRDEVKKLNG